MINKSGQVIIEAYNKGYYVSKDGYINNPKGKLLSMNFTQKGYVISSIRLIDGSRRSYHIHKLQAYQKFGNKIFEDGVVVRHLDGNPSNNSWDNIEVGTHQDNMLDIPKEIRIKKALKATSKVKKYDHKSILKDRENGMTYKELMKKYNISSKGTLSFIINKSYDKE